MSDKVSTPSAVERLAEVLADHDWFTPRGYAWPCCACGVEFWGGDPEAYAHVAAACEPVLADVAREAAAEALRDTADGLASDAAEAWGGRSSWLTTGEKVARLSAEWVRARADRLADGSAP